MDTHQTINGLGIIEAVFTNNGTVNANVSGQAITLNTNNMTNNSVTESTGGGNLTIAGISITQGSAGTINAATGTSGGMSPNPSARPTSTLGRHHHRRNDRLFRRRVFSNDQRDQYDWKSHQHGDD